MEVKPTHLKTNVIKPKFSENTRISIISKTPYHFTNINEKCSHSPKKTFSSFILSKIRELLAFNCIKKSQKKQPEEIIEFDLIEKQLENNFTISNNPEIINKNNEDLFNLIISPNQINQKPKGIEKNKFESTEQIKTNEFDSLSSDKKDYSFNHEYNEVENNDYNEISFQDEEIIQKHTFPYKRKRNEGKINKILIKNQKTKEKYSKFKGTIKIYYLFKKLISLNSRKFTKILDKLNLKYIYSTPSGSLNLNIVKPLKKYECISLNLEDSDTQSEKTPSIRKNTLKKNIKNVYEKEYKENPQSNEKITINDMIATNSKKDYSRKNSAKSENKNSIEIEAKNIEQITVIYNKKETIDQQPEINQNVFEIKPNSEGKKSERKQTNNQTPRKLSVSKNNNYTAENSMPIENNNIEEIPQIQSQTDLKTIFKNEEQNPTLIKLDENNPFLNFSPTQQTSVLEMVKSKTFPINFPILNNEKSNEPQKLFENMNSFMPIEGNLNNEIKNQPIINNLFPIENKINNKNEISNFNGGLFGNLNSTTNNTGLFGNLLGGTPNLGQNLFPNINMNENTNNNMMNNNLFGGLNNGFMNNNNSLFQQPNNGGYFFNNMESNPFSAPALKNNVSSNSSKNKKKKERING